MENDNFDVLKAIDTGNTSTGGILVPEMVEAGIRMFVETRCPLWQIVPKDFDVDGMSYGWKEQITLPVASFGIELAPLPDANNATYAERATPIKSVYIRGEVSGQLQAATRNVMNIVRREVNNSTLGMMRTLEQKIVSADSSVTPAEFDGLNKQITNVVYNDDSVAQDGSGAAQPLNLAFLDRSIDYTLGGPPTHFIMSKAMRRKLWSVYLPQIRYADPSSISGGFTVPSYFGIPVVAIDDNVSILNQRIIAPDMNMVVMPILQDFTYEEMAHTRDSLDYSIKSYLSLVVIGNGRHHAKFEKVTSVIE